ncbi:MAG: hypothetical protein JW842_07425, partial [Prolixibacteraceae bacterium]|nr:hypothetical protein [Prolixibacteraceae bacterium]
KKYYPHYLRVPAPCTKSKNNDIKNHKSLIDKVANAISGFEIYAREEKLNPGLIDDIRKELIAI